VFFLKDHDHLFLNHLFSSSSKIEFPLQVRKKKLSGKTFFFASQKEKGSLTVEAAFVMPMVIFAVAAFSYLMMVMGLQMKLQEALDMAGRRLAKYAYVYEQTEETVLKAEEGVKEEEPGVLELLEYGLNSAYAWKMVKDYAGEEWLERYFIMNGEDGIWIAGGDALSNDGIIDLALHYTVKIPYLPGESAGLHLVTRCRIKSWTGFEKKEDEAGEKETEEEVVYITETGKVYHTNKNCSHLRLSIEEVSLYNLEYMRNQGGGKYYPCERCFRNGSAIESQKVFIAKTGDRYHLDKECSGLKRTIIEIPISETGNRSKCKRCTQSGK